MSAQIVSSCVVVPESEEISEGILDGVSGSSVEDENSTILQYPGAKWSHLNSAQRENVVQLMLEFASLFQYTPRPCYLFLHDIESKGARPIRLPPYLNAHKRDFLTTEVERLLE